MRPRFHVLKASDLPNTFPIRRPGIEVFSHVLPCQLTECARLHVDELEDLVDLRQLVG